MIISKNNKPFKRKWRFTFEGFDENLNSIISERFIRINERPTFPHDLVVDDDLPKIISVPGKLQIFQSVLEYEEAKEEIKKRINLFNEKIEEVTSAILRLYAGCGTKLEEWKFLNTEISLCDHQSQLDWLEWSIKYQSSEWMWFDGFKKR